MVQFSWNDCQKSNKNYTWSANDGVASICTEIKINKGGGATEDQPEYKYREYEREVKKNSKL